MNSTSLPSFAGQQQRAKQRLLSADQLHSEGMIFRNPGFEKISLSPAPRKRSKSRTSRSSNEFEKSIENVEPVPEIPSQYRDERRSSSPRSSFTATNSCNATSSSTLSKWVANQQNALELSEPSGLRVFSASDMNTWMASFDILECQWNVQECYIFKRS